MPKTLLPVASTQPDTRVLAVLASLQRVALVAAALVAGVTLLAWTVPPVGSLLPVSWTLMKANTALCGLLSVLALLIHQPLRSVRAIRISRLLAATVTLAGAAVLAEYIFGVSFGIDRILGADPLSPIPGRMSPQTSASYILLGIVIFFITLRKGWLSRFVDVVTFALMMMVSVFTCGYLFGAMRLFGPSMQSRLAPQTLVVFLALTFTAFNRRAEYGAFSVLLDAGIGGKATRVAAPFAVALPFLLAVTRASIVKYGILQPEYATAIATSTMSLLAFALILILGRQVNRLERDIRDMSLRDSLTGLYNRRGFYVLAEQALRLARRARKPFSLLFLDLDNLKQTNDALGHEIGSNLIGEMAALLSDNFREIDVIARFGGDEFVVAGSVGEEEITSISHRLQHAASSANAKSGRLFPVSFSLGYVTCPADRAQTLDQMLELADKIMYEEKRNKKSGRAANSVDAAIAFVEPALQR